MRRDVPRRLFRGRDLTLVSAQARAALGDDVVILGTRTVYVGGAAQVEVVAAAGEEVERFRRRMIPPELVWERRPLVVALVGPSGAGKTTTVVKLALNAHAFGTRRVGLVTLDTFRAGAVAQLEAYAEVARLPLEVAYDARDVAGARARLARCDVILVDTPGRGPRATDDEPWRAMLAALAPDEVHLVVPATIRPDIAEHMRDHLDATLGAAAATTADDGADAGPRTLLTHALLTKLDEVPDEVGVADLAAHLALPMRWVTDGQEVPADLGPAEPRLLAALGTVAV